MMRLSVLLAALSADAAPRVQAEDPLADPPIRGICIDSRAVSPGDLFVALRGSLFDAHDHLEQALALGAAALVVEALPSKLDLRGCPAVLVPNTRRALAPLAARFFGDPGRELTLVGVTGTNGKTSTTYLIESILLAAGRNAGLIGTVEIRYGQQRQRAINTTPESLELQRTLRAMRNRGVDVVAMEVSSHGLELERIQGCRFDVAAVTNVTQDHLDFHDTMQAYLDAKLRLFRDHLRPGASAVVNVDDPAAPQFLAAARGAGARILRTSRRADTDSEVVLEDAQVRLEGTRARLRLPSGPVDVELPLIGAFNLENLLVAAASAACLGVDSGTIARGVASCAQVPGRVERVGAEIPGAPTVLVDYAHTPDAVEKLLRTVRPLARARLITVFGCGGDRDRGKRPLMAEAVARWSDRVIATSDNPRTEDPFAILADVEAGLRKLRRTDPEGLDAAPGSYAVMVDRRRAIARAVEIARSEDTVVLAGKGHEDYQIVGRERVPFDDRSEALRALRRRGAR